MKRFNRMFIKPVLLLSFVSFVFSFGIVRCAGEIDAQAETAPQVEISK